MRRLASLLIWTALAGAQSYEKRIVPVDPVARQSFDRQPKIAVLVGVGAYPEGSGLPPLKYPARDVADLAAELEKQGYSVRQLTDGQASRGLVVRTLSQIGQVFDPDQGTLLFYFSGHGYNAKGVNYLATSGVTVDDLERDGLSLTELERLVKSSRARRQMVWIDACRNDPAPGVRDASRRSFAQLDVAEGMRVLYSTRAGSVSYEDDTLKHGVFTHFLLRGLRGEAAGGDGLVTFQDLAAYVSDSVMNYGVKTGRIQRPFDAGEASGDFLLVKVASIAPPAATSALAPGRTKVNPKDGLTYVWIPPGKFMMGCSPGDAECNADEKPAHEVTITKGFWLGQTPVTQQVYERVTGETSPFKVPPNHPVNAWGDKAQAYCTTVGGRLPTEAEWEYAARANSVQARYGEIDRIAWRDGNEPKRSYFGRKVPAISSTGNTHEVAQTEPNAWGLYDMIGTVYQWTADWYAYYESGPRSDPTGPITGNSLTLRGSPRDVRVSTRTALIYRQRGTGFRCISE